MNNSMCDWLYFLWPIPVLCIVVLVLRSILSFLLMITTAYEATATAAAASFHCHGDESQGHRTPPKTIQLTWKQKGISNIKEEKQRIRYVGVYVLKFYWFHWFSSYSDMRKMLLIYMVLSLPCHYNAYFCKWFHFAFCGQQEYRWNQCIFGKQPLFHCMDVIPWFSPIFEMSTFAHFPIFLWHMMRYRTKRAYSFQSIGRFLVSYQ